MSITTGLHGFISPIETFDASASTNFEQINDEFDLLDYNLKIRVRQPSDDSISCTVTVVNGICAHHPHRRHRIALDLHGLSRRDPSSPVIALFGTAHSAPVSLTVASQELRPRFSGHNVLIVSPTDGNAVELFKDHK